MPVHNGTFDLAFHPWQEPFDRIHASAKAQGVALATPGMGEALSLKAPNTGRRWWSAFVRRDCAGSQAERHGTNLSAFHRVVTYLALRI